MSELALQLIEENKKTKATRLDLGNCGLTELPEELFECVWLEELILSDLWEISDIDHFILFSSQNKGEPNRIEKISESFRNLNNLKSFVAYGDYDHHWSISDFSFIRYLSNLKYLNIAYTNVEDISFIHNLKDLTSFSIDGTRVSNIEELVNLDQLVTFSCAIPHCVSFCANV